MMWLLMWLNRSVATINVTFHFLVIYRYRYRYRFIVTAAKAVRFSVTAVSTFCLIQLGAGGS